MTSVQVNRSNGVKDTAGEKPVVCFLGPISSYTHQATLDTFPSDKFELMPVVSIKDIFDTTQSGSATYGVVPFENSTNGSVVFTLDQLADRQSLYPDLSVCAEIYLDVHHCLLGQIPPTTLLPNMTTNAIPPFQKRDETSPSMSGHSTPTPSHPVPEQPRSKPLVSLSHIQRVYSHPQAWGQCTRFMNAYLRGVETIDVSSTSRAAELVKTDMSGTSAAVSSAIAAELLGLDFLGRNIEDREDNTTRFFVLRRGTGEDGSSIPGLTACLPKSPSRTNRGSDGTAPQPESAGEEQDQISRKMKSLVSFTVPHRAPGALADVLECFRKSGLNLTSINSRPSLVEPFQYLFFVEFEGHKFVDPEGRVKQVLERVGEVAASWRWLGSWENMRT